MRWWWFITCKITLKTHHPHTSNNKQTNKQTNNYATNYAQTLRENTTNTVPNLADNHKTVPSYICQEEETGDFEQSTKNWIPTLYCVCESAQPNNHYTAGGHSYRKICMPGKCVTVNEYTAGKPKICTRAKPAQCHFRHHKPQILFEGENANINCLN